MDMFAVGDKVTVPDNKDFTGYVGTVVCTEPTDRRTTRGIIRVVFPGHPWQGKNDTFGFDADELTASAAGE